MKLKVKYLCILIFALYCFPIHAQYPTNGLMGYWPFNGNANDESGNGNHGIVHGAVLTEDRFGISNSAYFLDGINNYISIVNSASLNPQNAISMCAWYKAYDFEGAGFSPIIDKGYYSHTYPYYQYKLGVAGSYQNSYYFALSVTNNNIPSKVYSPNHFWTPGNWYFLVGTYDGSMVNIYVNGELIESAIVSGLLSNYDTPVYFGNNTTANDFLKGVIDDIGIYNRALSSDEIKDIYKTLTISGEKTVCQGQQNVNYSTQPINNAIYNWNYSGTGCTIIGNSESVNLNFSNNSTSGILSVNVTGTNITSRTIEYPITVNALPFNAGIIMGSQQVCQNQSLNYSIPIIGNASGYKWEYSGNGETITGNDETITIFFNKNATSGILSVKGFNNCGEGNKSTLLITVNPLPSDAGTITGDQQVCQNQSLNYSIPIIGNATGYSWDYSGNGETITGNDETITIFFDKNATSGTLYINGINSCGEGNKSALPISVNPLPYDAGTIIGEQLVCRNQWMDFSIPVINNSTYYNWEYSGSGTVINGSSENISIFFNESAVSGNLYVNGVNNCGEGNKSPELFITVIACSEIPNNFNIPNAFSPNGDGLNDFFVIDGIPKNSSLTIFNRGGKIVYSSENYHNEWNGRDKNGKALQSDTYWFVLQLNGIMSEIKGFVYLKR